MHINVNFWSQLRCYEYFNEEVAEKQYFMNLTYYNILSCIKKWHLYIDNKRSDSSGMRTENLQAWMWEATWEKSPNHSQYETVVGLIQKYLHEGNLVDE